MTPKPADPRRVPFRLPELLAPAGDWECAKAAVENGADAIYFGLDKFNARMRAYNFVESDLLRLMEFLHSRGVKGYLTFNTLVFENEMAEAEAYMRTTIAAGVDAAIVQDVGMCRMIRRLSPDFPIHVSTQMTITSAAGVEFAKELGCNLVVLARECSLKEIEQIIAAASAPALAPGAHGVPALAGSTSASFPVEVFVHGALCVAYSGQCLTSEALGGRSANRGECAQACRMPYDLISDGKQVALGDKKYLLSPQDLAGLEVLPELLRMGVASVKIEGRLKSPEYVANITRIYRQQIDRLAAPDGGNSSEGVRGSQYEMEMAFSRGLYTGWFKGSNNQELVHARFGKKRGVYLGEVRRVDRDSVEIHLVGPVKRGDGVVFDAGHPEEKEEGGRVYDVELKRSGLTALAFGRGDLNISRIHVGDKVWKTSDPELDRRLRQTFEGDKPRFQRPIVFELHGHVGLPLTVIAKDELGNIVKLESAMLLVEAQNQPLTEIRLREQFGRLGGTPFSLGGLESRLEGNVLLPVSELNRLRRAVVEQLEMLRKAPRRWTLLTEAIDVGQRPDQTVAAPPHAPEPELIVLVRNLSQLETAISIGVTMTYCEFEDPKKYRDAVILHRSRSKPEHSTLFVAPPRIFKMGEEWTLKQVRSSEAQGYLVRNYDHLKFFADERCIGDFSLNVANHVTAEYFIEKYRLERVTASYDLNFLQLEALLQASRPEWFEVTIHQHMPMFHMEHCVFCAFLSDGTDFRNCGRPCDKHDLKLRDRVGAEHPVKADAGCRNTVFNARAQSGADYVERMLALGVRHFRIEFVNESPAAVSKTISKYRELLRRESNGHDVWRELKLLNQLGVTRGQMGA